MSDGDEETRAVVLDVLPQGRSSDDRPQYEREPLALALGEERFALYELTLADESDVSIGDWVVVAPSEARAEDVVAVRETDYGDLTSAARSELEYAVEDVVDATEERFVDFYNDAGPVTLRLHQLNLLPGIGDKLRDNILDERKREPFSSFEDIADRVDGLHEPREVLVERILSEIRDEDMKYYLFAHDRAE